MWKRLTQKVKLAPPIRNCISMDTNGQNIFIFGGLAQNSKERFNDVWIYNISGFL